MALAVHALAEGVAVGALLAGQSRRRVGGWLAALCLSPAAGAAAISAYRLPSAAGPVLLALAAGVLAQAARISLRAASRTPAGRRLAPGAATALLAAAALTAMAVRGRRLTGAGCRPSGCSIALRARPRRRPDSLAGDQPSGPGGSGQLAVARSRASARRRAHSWCGQAGYMVAAAGTASGEYANDGLRPGPEAEPAEPSEVLSADLSGRGRPPPLPTPRTTSLSLRRTLSALERGAGTAGAGGSVLGSIFLGCPERVDELLQPRVSR